MKNRATQTASMIFILMCALTIPMCVREPSTGHLVFAVLAIIGFPLVAYLLTSAILRARGTRGQ
ncbi:MULTISPECIES: hypothetical protein [unclassified Luteococcus]|uniref:hypothetical protein n=1 Tax=unclassified Luteococcus TaxID=2639923 RepID=UPI00313E6F8A